METNAEAEEQSMSHPPGHDPNTELQGFEPLRVLLAFGALLLGLIAGIH